MKSLLTVMQLFALKEGIRRVETKCGVASQQGTKCYTHNRSLSISLQKHQGLNLLLQKPLHFLEGFQTQARGIWSHLAETLPLSYKTMKGN